MRHDLASFTSAANRSRSLRVIAAFYRRLAKDLFDPYHPERHYMRGPGPKWQAKHRLSAGSP